MAKQSRSMVLIFIIRKALNDNGRDLLQMPKINC